MRTTLLGLAAAAAIGAASSAQATIITFVVPLSGAQEVNAQGTPNQGDPDGRGVATLRIDDVALTIDWDISVSDILLPPSGAHIHNAAIGVNGPIVVDFNRQLTGSGLQDNDLRAVLADPRLFYVNVHNTAFPGGAIRGQIATPEPASLLLFGASLAGLALTRRRR